MKNNMFVIFVLITLFSAVNLYSQGKKYFIAANWNLENLFDTTDDQNKNDEEFTPESIKGWTQERLDKKLFNLSRVISSMDEGKGPDLLGVEEVEHEALLDSMINNFLHQKNYKVAFDESPDERGIDVGLIYNSDLFKLLNVSADTVFLPDKYPTRLILKAELVSKNMDTIYVFVNHWPSRRGGLAESEVNRLTAAMILRTEVNKIFLKNSDSKIILLGDFNDEPKNKSIAEILNARDFSCDSIAAANTKDLYNLAYKESESGIGSYMYKSNWNMLDQIIISGNLLSKDYHCGSFEVYKPEFMITRSGSFKGAAFPTYGGGNRYLGGYSDHFPVIAKFSLN